MSRTTITTRRQQNAARAAMPATRKRRRRAFDAAKQTLLQSNWSTWTNPIDVDLRHGLDILRARSRSEAQNNDHAKHFLRLVKTNVIGRQGIALQGRVRTRGGKQDRRANDAIEDAWRQWGGAGSPDVTGQWGWKDVQRSAVEAVARDGEILVRKIAGWNGNAFRFAVQLIDPAQLDTQLNKDLGGGFRIVMGVELDAWRRPVAYHLFPDEPLSQSGHIPRGGRIRVPAREIVHCYLPEWIWQTRGVPWMSTTLKRAHNLAGYEDAEVTSSRAAAGKMGFYEQTPDAADLVLDGEDVQGNPIQEFAPGEIPVLPPGWKFAGWDPQHPNSGYDAFVKASLRGIASGLGVNYNTLANDLQGVNYTSLRHGMLTERDVWMAIQDWFVDAFVTRIYNDWLRNALLFGQIKPATGRPFGIDREDDFRRVSWQPRRWPWVDPLKETQANAAAHNLRTRSLSDIIRESGRDADEVWLEIQRDNERLAELGIASPTVVDTPAPAPTPDDGDGAAGNEG